MLARTHTRIHDEMNGRWHSVTPWFQPYVGYDHSRFQNLNKVRNAMLASAHKGATIKCMDGDAVSLRDFTMKCI